MPPVVPPFLVGLIVAPLAKRVLKPLMRGVVKTSVGLVLEVKKAAHEAGENIHDLAAEVAAEMVAAQIAVGEPVGHAAAGPRVAAGGDPNGGRDDAAGRSEDEARTPKIRATAGAGKAN
ncbi:DUF5132 domain-containing protein [Kitasatospora sp. GP82]|uniref:DUF5132 domain-containing protein n=1 Tax=Kitasatospora sp. GP82 TaxID=3035089 RepID=UPI002474F070|nr:DUF5132 domain-containing protein [Kitasatospora sp. GP82]MDH6127510.1 hypothetical protein [Kitasatospora sp. GP82]